MLVDQNETSSAQDEITPLIRNTTHSAERHEPTVRSNVFEDQTFTTWQAEARTLADSSRPLILACLLQYSLNATSILTIGHIGKVELGAVSVAVMVANVTGLTVLHGIATSLDTLCPQAYGSGQKKLVGLHLQRMVIFLWFITIPIGIIWLNAGYILGHIIPEQRMVDLAGTYLRIVLCGAPGYAAFESGKRFMQAQKLFAPQLYILLLLAPMNIFMQWLFVWHLGWGFIGAPISVAVTQNLLPVSLILYVRFIDGRQCWVGFSRAAFEGWAPMVQLSIPGATMVLAEYLSFEVLTLSTSWIGTTELAAQSIIMSLIALTFYFPFAVSIAASTRIATLIGATRSPAARLTAKVALIVACFLGAFNTVTLTLLRRQIPRLFTNDPDVIDQVTSVLPVVTTFLLFDATATICNGIIRGIGRQKVGGWVNLFCHYAVGLPLSLSTCFGLKWDLYGLWTGPIAAMLLVSVIESVFISEANWTRAAEDARVRNNIM